MIINSVMVKHLIIKDWQVHQKIIAAYVGAGILGLALVGFPHIYSFYMGLILLLTVMVAAGFHVINLTLIFEKKEQTVPFIMSLPIRPVEYALAKMLANLTIFIVPWMVMVVGLVFITLTGPIPNGMLPFMLLVSLHLVVNYVIVLSVTMLTDSEGWSIFSMVLVNLFLNPVIMLMLRSPEFNRYLEGEVIVWNSLAFNILMVQLAIIVAALSLIMYRQSRRLTFI